MWGGNKILFEKQICTILIFFTLKLLIQSEILNVKGGIFLLFCRQPIKGFNASTNWRKKNFLYQCLEKCINSILLKKKRLFYVYILYKKKKNP